MSRIYKVKTPQGERLVEAGTKGQAIGHCVSTDYSAEPITASDLHAAIQAGQSVEKVVPAAKKQSAAAATMGAAVEAGLVSGASTQTAPIQPAPQQAVAPSAAVAPPSNPAPVAGWTPPAQAADSGIAHIDRAASAQAPAPAPTHTNPVIAEQQRINPDAAAAAGAPAPQPILATAPRPAPAPAAVGAGWTDRAPTA